MLRALSIFSACLSAFGAGYGLATGDTARVYAGLAVCALNAALALRNSRPLHPQGEG